MTDKERLQKIKEILIESHVELQYGEMLRKAAQNASTSSSHEVVRKSPFPNAVSMEENLFSSIPCDESKSDIQPKADASLFKVAYKPLGNLFADVRIKHMIWSEDIGDIVDWKDFLEDEGLANADEAKQYEAVYRMNSDYLDDEQYNLNVEMNGTILAIGDIETWQGRRIGYREIDRTTVNGIFDVEAAEYFCDAYNVRATYHHHDGTNKYLFRVVPFNTDITRLLDALYFGEATPEMIRRYTRSMRPYVSAVYGWGGRQLFSSKEVVA